MNKAHKKTRKIIKNQHNETRKHITKEFKKQQTWFLNTFLEDYLAPAMSDMTEQLSVVGMQQVMSIGSFLDAKHQLETQRIFQDQMAQAHKDYHPSTGMCTFGTLTRSLSATSRNKDLTAYIVSKHALDRQLGQLNVNAATGSTEDKKGRLSLFKERYCDVSDNNNGFASICNDGKSSPAETINKDVDYTRTIALAGTLDIDFTNEEDKDGELAATGDEKDIFALTSNIFSHDVFTRPPEKILEIIENQDDYMDLRSVLAKRSVATNSFHAIISMRAAGTEKTEETGTYLQVVMKQLGVPDKEIETLLGKRPSYYTQMDILGQKIYQNPHFYTNLYDKPVNVARKNAAMQAIGLMMDRDMYKSELRSESVLAVLLELELMKLQNSTQNHLNWMDTFGKEN